MSFPQLMERLATITTELEIAIRASELVDAELVTVSNNGGDFLTARSQEAGAVIVYPFPRITLPHPKARRVEWRIGIVARSASSTLQAASRCVDLLEVVTASGIVAWRADAPTIEPADFALSEDPQAPRIPGWAITITEEHLP